LAEKLQRESLGAQNTISEGTGVALFQGSGQDSGKDASLNDDKLNETDQWDKLNETDQWRPGWKATFSDGWYDVPFGHMGDQAHGTAASGLFAKPAAPTPHSGQEQDTPSENLSADFSCPDQSPGSDVEMADDVSSAPH
jgi:hypothetical protein